LKKKKSVPHEEEGENQGMAVAAGADVLVAGTAIFGESEGVSAAMDRLRAGIKQLWKQSQQVE